MSSKQSSTENTTDKRKIDQNKDGLKKKKLNTFTNLYKDDTLTDFAII